MYAAILAISMIDVALLFAYGNPAWQPILTGYLGLLLQGGCLLAIGSLYLDDHQKSDCCRRRDVCFVPAALGAELGDGAGAIHDVEGYRVLLRADSL